LLLECIHTTESTDGLVKIDCGGCVADFGQQDVVLRDELREEGLEFGRLRLRKLLFLEQGSAAHEEDPVGVAS